MIKTFVKKALEEDIGRGDLFNLIGKNSFASANIVCKDVGIFAGKPYVKALCKMNKLDITFYFKDGDTLQKGDLVARIEGKSKTILRCERTILNLMQHASGIASNVAQYKKVLEGYSLKL
jgi:nicotinate-nucleotide pyrophosphorylase (carboxylating)